MILNFFVVLLIIGLVVLIHELGHFLAARLTDMQVDEFSFGFGPKLVSKKFGETEYMIKLFPIGGYVKILGEEEEVKNKRSFSEKSIGARLFVIVSGVVMNVFLAVILFYIVLIGNGFKYDNMPYYEDFNVWFGSQEEVYLYPVTVVDIIDNGGADNTGLKEPFEILSVQGEDIKNIEELQSILKGNKGRTVSMMINTDLEGENLDKVDVDVNDDGKIGVELASDVRVWRISYNGWEKVFSGPLHFLNMTKANVFIIGKLLSKSVKEKTVEPIAQSVSGPIGLFVIVDIVREFGGIEGLIDLTGTINLTLALVNLFPLPAFDGGRAVLIIIEAIRGKKLNEKLERWIIGGSVVLMFTLMFVVSAKDIFQFGIWDWVRDVYGSLIRVIE